MMSISAVTFNVAMLATYGYFTYNSCKKNVEETRVEKKKNRRNKQSRIPPLLRKGKTCNEISNW